MNSRLDVDKREVILRLSKQSKFSPRNPRVTAVWPMQNLSFVYSWRKLWNGCYWTFSIFFLLFCKIVRHDALKWQMKQQPDRALCYPFTRRQWVKQISCPGGSNLKMEGYQRFWMKQHVVQTETVLKWHCPNSLITQLFVFTKEKKIFREVPTKKRLFRDGWMERERRKSSLVWRWRRLQLPGIGDYVKEYKNRSYPLWKSRTQ